MKYVKTLLLISLLFLIACNEDEPDVDDTPMETTTTNDYGSYLYNGEEKNLIDGFFRVSESNELLLTLVDEDDRVGRLFLYDFDGSGLFQNPAPTPELTGRQYYFLDGMPEYFWLSNDSSMVSVLNLSEDLVSGSFSLSFTGAANLIGANWTEGQFYDVPAYELVSAGVGEKYLSRGTLVTIDSMHTRITNTFFAETYIYGTSDLGYTTRDVFRFESFLPDDLVNPPWIFYGSEPYQFYDYVFNVENSFSENSFTTDEIVDEHHRISIRFENQSIDEQPKPFGADGELLLYRQDETIGFDEVNINLDYGADTVLVATNQFGNTLIAEQPPVTSYQFGLDTNGERPGVDIQLCFYSSGTASEPDWTSRGYMHYRILESGIINLGYETYYLAPDDIIPTYLRMKNHIL